MGVSTKGSKSKDKAVAFVNWTVGSIHSSKGFPVFDNQYTTKEEQALVDLARKHGGSVKVRAELRIVLNTANERPEEYNIDDIEIIED